MVCLRKVWILGLLRATKSGWVDSLGLWDRVGLLWMALDGDEWKLNFDEILATELGDLKVVGLDDFWSYY